MTADPRDLDADVVEMLRAAWPNSDELWSFFLKSSAIVEMDAEDLRTIARWARERQDRAWCAGRDAAAKVVEDNMETLTSTKDGAAFHLTPRRRGSLTALSFSDAIRALSPPATTEAK